MDGIRTLAYVTDPEQLLFSDGGLELRYKLHNGLLGFTTGLERLAKLTVSANHFRLHGEYPKVSKYSHAVTRLLDAVEDLDISSIPDGPGLAGKYVQAGRPDVPATLVPLLEKYAKGGGRYEYLDSLSGSDVEPGLYRDWIALAGGCEEPDWLGPYLALTSYIPHALYKVAHAAEAQRGWNAEILLQPYIDQFDVPLHPKSVAMALHCFRLARWVTAFLSVISNELFYPSSGVRGKTPTFPYLCEVVDSTLLHSAENYFGFFVLRLDDPTAVREALEGLVEPGDWYDEDDDE
ncbi:hypothetical protein JOD64_003153 [Micromonospora luteifusca]|uniref:Uncharacterized protein n=1 Tax=Micromonospora luteifusca TaxID=709860 RepID=A0ABS2LUR8_9ACTN|nr:hypothetical protein [Micromonospora luteifusca]MBM7491931.1 hypothetical protein [Micromonospora luteifusca]